MFYFPLELLQIYKSDDYPKIRLGRGKDGGYVIIDGLEYDLLLGCGISNDDSFEHCFLKKYTKINCFAFDGTIKNLPNSHERINFVKKNISDKNSSNTTNLHKIINNYQNIFLKMDIEGCEYKWLHSLSNEHLSKISQIVIEFHSKYFNLPRFNDKYLYSVFEKLNKTHYLMHLHGNNYKKTALFNGYRVKVGSSNCNIKKIKLDKKYKKNTNIVLQHHNKVHKFEIKIENKTLIVKRIDQNNGWNYEHKVLIGGNQIPNVFECTFVRKDLITSVYKSNDKIPSELDMKNCLKKNEIELKGYPYNNLN